MVLFEADRAAVFLRNQEGKAVSEVSRGLSAAYLNAVREFPVKRGPAAPDNVAPTASVMLDQGATDTFSGPRNQDDLIF